MPLIWVKIAVAGSSWVLLAQLLENVLPSAGRSGHAVSLQDLQTLDERLALVRAQRFERCPDVFPSHFTGLARQQGLDPRHHRIAVDELRQVVAQSFPIAEVDASDVRGDWAAAAERFSAITNR